MKFIKYLFVGIFFGIVLTKSEAISWYRIVEMFRFEAFHMYGIIGTAVVLGAIGLIIMKQLNIKTIDGETPNYPVKPANYKAALLGGSLFGLGWAMTGACPGPLYILFGHGIWVIGVVILSAMFGTFCYGLIKDRLPH